MTISKDLANDLAKYVSDDLPAHSMHATEAVAYRGIVERVYYSSTAFTAGLLRCEDEAAFDETLPFAGRLCVKQGDAITIRGKWVNSKFGEQVQVAGFEFNTKLTPKGLERYLSLNPAFYGIGKVKARAIAERFAADFENVLFNHPDKLAREARISAELILTVQREWSANAAYNTASSRLAAFDLTHKQIQKLINHFGNSAVTIVEADPFVLIGLLPGFGFRKIDVIGRKIGIPKETPSRVEAGILALIDEQERDGHCFVEHRELQRLALEILNLDTMDAEQIVKRHIDQLIDSKRLTALPYSGSLLIAHPQTFAVESYLESTFTGKVFPNPYFRSASGVEEVVIALNPHLNADQRQAVTRSATNTISLICGGAGTGKTYVSASIVELYERASLTVALAAPTGKAAKRMEQVIGHSARTIHRLLEYDPFTRSFARNADKPIEAALVLIDEVSMVDSPLFYHLLRAIDFTRTALVLVGDHNQLPPVGCGNALRDLIQRQMIPTTILQTVVRQAGTLKENSTAILRGEVRETATAYEDRYTNRSPVARPWYLVDKHKEPAQIVEFIKQLFNSHLSDKLGFDLLRDVQLLTPQHKGPLGARELNLLLQRIIQKKLYNWDIAPVDPLRRAPFYPGDKVIQTKNNYDLGVMNGTIGKIVSIDSKLLTVQFEDEPAIEIERDSDDINNIQLAYALTIHKYQGSEIPCAICIIHKSHSFMHNRSLFYTAVTRARQTAIIIGDSWGIRNAASKVQVDKRRTFLSLASEGDVQ